MMAVIPRSPPDVPDVEAYKAGRPASGLGAYSLAALPSHVLGVRALRAHGSTATIADWTGGDDANNGTAFTALRIPVRPSPLSEYLWLGVWFAASPAPSPRVPSIVATLRKDSSLAAIDQTRQWTPTPTMRAGARVGVVTGTPADVVPTVGLLAGREALVSTTWLPVSSVDAGDVGPFSLAGNFGVDLWVFVQATDCIVLAAHCVEIARGAT